MKRTLSFLFLSLSAYILQPTTAPAQSGYRDEIDVWIGTGKSPLSKGIYHCRLNSKTGKLSQPSLVAEVDGPGFLALHPDRTKLYAVCDVNKKPSVAAYGIEKKDGASSLRFINSVEVGDGGATHLSIDKSGRTIVTAQYGGGSVAVFSLNTDGSLKERTQLIDHEGGSKVVAGRQDASHAHWAGFSNDQRFVMVPDLGLDQVVIYAFDAENSQLKPSGAATTPPGSGPRHMKFHQNNQHALVLNELSLTVTSFAYEAKLGQMSPLETVATVPENEKAKEQAVSASEICIHPNGRFVYSANRGHDTITAFRFDERTGKLTEIEREFTRGATPRNFNIDPTGKWLVVAGQDSHTLGVFAIDGETGELTWNRSSVFVPSGICVVFGE
jgi:6-phosphogluconolactonase